MKIGCQPVTARRRRRVSCAERRLLSDFGFSPRARLQASLKSCGFFFLIFFFRRTKSNCRGVKSCEWNLESIEHDCEIHFAQRKSRVPRSMRRSILLRWSKIRQRCWRKSQLIRNRKCLVVLTFFKVTPWWSLLLSNVSDESACNLSLGASSWSAFFSVDSYVVAASISISPPTSNSAIPCRFFLFSLRPNRSDVFCHITEN